MNGRGTAKVLLVASMIFGLTLSSNFAQAANKIGGKCTKQGATTAIDGVVAKCDKANGKSLTWVSTGMRKDVGGGSSNPAQNSSKNPGAFTANPDNPPQFITANFVDPNKIYFITKFRSGIGHDFSTGSGETCRSMKHYLTAMDVDAPDYKVEGGGSKSAMPVPVPGVDVPIYSPVSGVFSIEPGDGIPINQAVDIVPDIYTMVTIRLMHVFPLKGLKDGQKVKAGQQVGLVLRNQTFDAGIEAQVNDSKNKSRYISIFLAMTNSVFAEWKKRGATSRDQFVLTKAEVDANPWKCIIDPNEKPGNYQFAENYLSTPEWFARNAITLTGYDEVIQKMNQKYGK